MSRGVGNKRMLPIELLKFESQLRNLLDDLFKLKFDGRHVSSPTGITVITQVEHGFDIQTILDDLGIVDISIKGEN